MMFELGLGNACPERSSPSRAASMSSYEIKHHFELLCNLFLLLTSTYLSRVWQYKEITLKP